MFSTKILSFFQILAFEIFNENLTNDVFSFEQLGPDINPTLGNWQNTLTWEWVPRHPPSSGKLRHKIMAFARDITLLVSVMSKSLGYTSHIRGGVGGHWQVH